MEKDKDTEDFIAIATKLYEYLGTTKSKIPENYTQRDIGGVLEKLYNEKIYPNNKIIPSLHQYWENSCKIAKEGGAINE